MGASSFCRASNKAESTAFFSDMMPLSESRASRISWIRSVSGLGVAVGGVLLQSAVTVGMFRAAIGCGSVAPPLLLSQ